MEVLDHINRIHGHHALHYAGEALSGRWRMRQRLKSSSYTTRRDEFLTIDTG